MEAEGILPAARLLHALIRGGEPIEEMAGASIVALAILKFLKHR